MTKTIRFRIAIVLLLAFAFLTTHPASAQGAPIGISNGQAVAIVATGAVIVAGVGTLLYFSLRSPRAITGCLVSGRDGTAIQSDSDGQVYLLAGDASALQVGDRVEVKGKRSKDKTGGSSFVVKRLQKDYGACALLPSTAPGPAPRARR